MLSWRLHTRPEKAELQELNARLYDYVCRVRELERENLLLEEELRGRRRQEGLGVNGQARWAEEARRLRQQLDELSWATALAEGERDTLRRELRELQLLGEEERAARGRLDAELGVQRRELQEAQGARAALEAMLGRLQAERRGLDAAHEREVRELRARAASLTLHYRARTTGPAAPPPRLREVHDSYALLVSESWRDAVHLYEDEVRELEAALRRGQESRLQAEEETRLCAQEAEALQRQALELEQLRVLLEDELQRKREAYELQAKERQSVLSCLEDEKAALTLAMADRLRDYQELVQVKTGLSLEVATYRALLEGESNPEILILTERLENLPREFGKTSYHYTNSVLQRENERNLFSRQKAPSGSFRHSSSLHPNLWAQQASQTGSISRRGFLGSGYPSFTTTTQREKSYEKTASSPPNVRTLSPAHGLGRNTDAQLKTFPGRPRTEGTRDIPIHVAREPTLAQESHRERRDNVVADASESTWSNERTVILGKKTEARATREQERNRAGTVQSKQEEKMFDSKEKASEERNLRWEELTKLDKEARQRGSQHMRDKAEEKEPLKEQSVREREVPIRLEVSKDSTPEGTPKGFQIPLKKDAGGGPAKGVERKEAKLRWDARDAAGSLTGDSMTETIAENIVSGILKQLAQSPDTETSADSSPDTRVTYVGRKELPGGKKTKTEIVVESKLTEEVDVSEEAGQDYLLSMDGRDKVGLKGKPTEQMIGDIINLGLKGRHGTAKVVNVEIVEEPMSYMGGEKAGEVSTPFHVQEVDDMSPGSQGLAEEAGYGETEVTFSVHQRKKTELSQENVSHVEEVTEAGDSEGEQNYFVSTPDECPEHDIGHDRDEGSVYGQIHIEEESTIRYSWQDEIVPGSRRIIRGGDALGEKVVKPLDVLEPSLKGDVSSPPWKEQARSGEFHAEATVIEKEVKIPHEFHTSMRRASKEPRHQLVEVIGQLEENLPGRLKEELSALTKEGQGGSGNVAVDVKKVQTSGGGAMTLVAEVNLSETMDTEKLDLELLGKDETGEIEKAVESVVRDAMARRYSPAPGSPDREAAGPAPVAGFGFKRWATQELYRPSAEDDDTGWASRSTQRVTSHGPVSATIEVTSPTGFAQSHVLEDVHQSVRHIKIDSPGIWRTERVPREGPTAEVVEVSGEGGPSQAESSVGASWSVRHLTLGPEQSQVSKEIFFEGPDPAYRDAGGTAELSTDTDRPGGHSVFGSKQFHAQREMIFPSSFSGGEKVGDYFRTEELVGTQTSVKHLQLGPREGLSAQIQFTAPFSDSVELGVREASVHTEDRVENGTPIRHVTVGPHRRQTTEQTVSQHGEFSDSESGVHGASSADVTQVTRSYTMGRKVLMSDESTFQGAVSESPQEASGGDTSGAEATLGMSRSFRHIRLGPGETQTSEHIVFHGPVSKTFALAGSVDAPELGESAGGSRMQRHVALGPKETSFTFQMDVSNVEATPSWTREATVLFPAGTEAEAHSVSDSGTWRDAGSRNGRAASTSVKGKEQAEFDKTVQLQRMVDQRSVVSDEKQVAVLYLDSQEEEDEGHWF
ncbi:PREDICTED: synemin isoform X1 [Hipposideros armiger]|uniref:Synemin isoform X1 n=1 Tax=Hipposideros armiger TaxID=186990 RepID=A0A8B7QX82_HIPAR|nr:PREDICTED: synemin isoform X1 [Hipposideros armiger]